jgi:IS1 family transposase
LRPIVEAQLAHVLQSGVLAMDETPIKASREQKGKMKQAYFWPVYGEDDEVVFTYSDGRGRQQVEKLLKTHFKGTLITDGYAAYARYVQKTEGITHAQCWVHYHESIFIRSLRNRLRDFRSRMMTKTPDKNIHLQRCEKFEQIWRRPPSLPLGWSKS